LRKLKYFIIPLVLGIIFASCEKDDQSVIDPVLSFPSILNYYITPTILNSDTVNCIAGVTVQSDEPLSSVTAKLYGFGDSVIVIADLKDNGVYPDTTAGDNKYTGVVYYNFFCRQVGIHKVEFIATNNSGLNSPLITDQIEIIRNPNLPPVVSGIIISPESTPVNQTAALVFMITALDPDGQCDIARVFYRGFAPNGDSLTPRNLFDDGSCCFVDGTGLTSGDTTANDNKFTRLLVGPPNQTGYYRYYIKAVDRSGDTSNVLSDSILVF
jgi:hypothetical protein